MAGKAHVWWITSVMAAFHFGVQLSGSWYCACSLARSLSGFTKRKTAIVIISDTCVFPAVTSNTIKKRGQNQLISQTNCVKHQVTAPPSSCCNKSFFSPAGFSTCGTQNCKSSSNNKTNQPCLSVCVCVCTESTSSSLLKVHYKNTLPPSANFTFCTVSWGCQTNCVEHKLQLSWH